MAKSPVSLPFNNSHAFIIGINEYQHVPKLKSAIKDARDIARVLEQEQGYIVHTLIDASQDQLLELLGDPQNPRAGENPGKMMRSIVQPNDRVFFYFAGHGIAFDSEKDPEGYLVPIDAASRGKEKLIKMDLLHKTLDDLKCKHGLLVLDCCFAGSFKWSTGFRSLIFENAGEEMYEERFLRFVNSDAWQVITSSAQDQQALDLVSLEQLDIDKDHVSIQRKKGNNSPFAAAFKRALEGQADVVRRKKSDGVITASELYLFLRDSVEEEARKQGTRQSPAIFTLSKHDTKGEFIFIHPRHPLTLSPAPDYNPYRGLSPFGMDVADVQLFFGRNQAIEKMHQVLKNSSILVVSAPSGQGKSSVVQAGLFPFFEKEGGYPKDRVHILRPGDRDPQKWTFLDRINASDHRLILVDQYEEMYTAAAEFRESFEEKLLELGRKINLYAQANPGKIAPLKLILTLRSDFEWQLKSSAFGQSFWNEQRIRDFLYHLPAMTQEELREAMIRPAHMVAYEFESEEMVNYILQEIHHAPGGLPLLSFALQKLYALRDRDRRMFSWKSYLEDLGGINGALSKHADAIYAGLPDDAHRACMRKIILRMVRLNAGSYTRRRVYLKSPSNKVEGGFIDELNYFPDHLDTVKNQILETLEAALLIIRNQDEFGLYIEPMHDSLINFWPRCLQWIQDFGKENLILQRQLWQAVLEHHQWMPSRYGRADGGKITAPLWDQNPKLQQIQLAVTDPKDEWLCKKGWGDKSISSVAFLLWEESPTADQMESLESWNWFFKENDPLKRFQKIQQQMDRWLNEDELIFVKDSFDALRSELERIKAERNAAIQAKERAEEQTRIAEARRKEAEAQALAANARSMPRSEMIQALQLAKYAYGQIPLPEVSQTLAAIFYAQFGGENGVRLPLYSLDLNEHPDRIVSADFTEDGQAIITAYPDGLAKYWSLQGKLLREETESTVFDNSHIYSPDEQYRFRIGLEGMVHLAQRDGTPIRSWNTEIREIFTASFSPNALLILTVAYQQVSLWKLSGEKQMELPADAHNLSIHSAVFSPDGQYILTASMDQTAKLWNLQGELIQEYTQHTNELYSAVFSPDGQYILTASRDTTAKLWNLDGRLLADLDLHTGPVNTAVFSPDSQYILTSADDQTVKLWFFHGELVINLPSHERPWTDQHTELKNTALISPDGQYILTHFGSSEGAGFPSGIDHSTRLWNRQGKLQVDWNKEWGYVGPAIFSEDGQKIHTPFNQEGPRFWTLEGKAIESQEMENVHFQIAPGSIEVNQNDMIPSPDGKYHLLLSKEKDYRLMLNDRSGKQIATLNHDKQAINTAVFSPDGNYILTTSWDKTAKIWDLKGNLLTSLLHIEAVRSAIFSPDGQYILSISLDETAKLWNLKGELLANLNKHQGYLDQAVFSADGQFILTASYDGTAKLWPVPARIYQYLDTESPISGLSDSQKKKYRIH